MNTPQSIGIIWPGPPTLEDIDETRQFLPEDIDLHLIGTQYRKAADLPKGITLERLLNMPGDSNIEDAGRELLPKGPAAIGYGCTSASYVRGVGGDRDIADRITAATGLPATTTSSAAVTALRRLGVRRLSVLSPHVDELNERLAQFLADSGFDVMHVRGLNKLGGIEDIPQQDISDLVLQLVDRPDIDGVFVSCTGMRTSSILDSMEEAIGKPIVSALQATVWDILRIAGRAAEMQGVGSLYRQAATA